jgi:response regulator of citrate/malate metabolism
MARNIDVLIADDQKDICEIYVDYLEALSVFRNIIVAHDGVDAEKKLRNQSFGLILLDINMPKKNGMAIIDSFSIYPMNQLEKVVVISGELDKHVLSQALQKGVKHFLVKPFDQQVFSQKMLQVIGKKV